MIQRLLTFPFGIATLFACLLVTAGYAQPLRPDKKTKPVIHKRPHQLKPHPLRHEVQDPTPVTQPAVRPTPSAQEVRLISLPVSAISTLRITVTGTAGATVYECTSAIFEVQEDSFSLLVPLGGLYKKVGVDGSPIHLQDLLADNLLRLSGKFGERPPTTRGVGYAQSLALLQLGKIKRYIDLPLTFKVGKDGSFRLQTYYEDNFKEERQWLSEEERKFFDSKITIDLK